jgi:hypothetical protein
MPADRVAGVGDAEALVVDDRLFYTRLRWTGGRGIARLNGKTFALKSPPILSTIGKVDSIDYVPAHIFMVMPMFQGWRDLYPNEAEECDALLYEAHRTGES